MTENSNKKKIIINGRVFDSISSAADSFGLSRNTVDYRLSKGWTPEEAVGLEPRPSHAGKTPGIPVRVQGHEFNNIKEAAKYYGRSYSYLFDRLKQGCTVQQALGLVEPQDSLQTIYPELAEQWHPTKNAALTPDSVAPNSSRKAWWLCRKGHQWHAVINSRIKGDGCPFCAGRDPTGGWNFAAECPDLLAEWDWERNSPKKPEGFGPRSDCKVWWKCVKGHSWQAIIKNRARGSGCPLCAGQKPTVHRNLATEYPELLAEWDWEKNRRKRPEDFTPRSSKKVWWKCKKGHSWQAYISNRTRDTRNLCPYCSNRKLCDDNSLASVRPDIAKDWHPYKNAPLTPRGVIAGGSKKVWWICKHGHEWRATVGSRVIRRTGCSKCSLQTSKMEIAVYSELNALFDDVMWRAKISGYECDVYLRNKGIGIEIDGVYWHSRKPEQELAKSAVFESEGIQLFRLREEGLPALSERDICFKSSEDKFLVVSRLLGSLLKHAELTDEQRATLHGYTEGSGLLNEELYRQLFANLPAPPPGESLADKQPNIAKQWAYDLNAPLAPEHFRHQANKNVWWRCGEGHTWKVSINNRTQHGTGCPVCPRHNVIAVTEEWNLAVVHPDVAREWHPNKNGDIRPEAVRPKTNQKIWWRCSKGHEWQAVVASRVAGNGCPYCSGRYATEVNNLASKYPELLEEWDRKKNEGINPVDLTPYVNKKVWWRCREGHNWQATISNRTRNKSGCPACAQSASRKYSIEDFRAMAKERGGKCLSETYISSRKKLKFRCKEGHIWETRADSMLYTSKWCPVCGRKR